MVAIWTENSPFLKTPIYQPVQPYPDFQLLPYPTVGMDTATGKRDVTLQAPSNVPALVIGAEQRANTAIPTFDDLKRKDLEYQIAMTPIERERQRLIRQDASAQNLRDLQQFYPILLEAGDYLRRRAREESEKFLAFKERQPSAAQQRLYQAQLGGASEATALAQQVAAARQSVGRFQGKNIAIG